MVSRPHLRSLIGLVLSGFVVAGGVGCATSQEAEPAPSTSIDVADGSDTETTTTSVAKASEPVDGDTPRAVDPAELVATDEHLWIAPSSGYQSGGSGFLVNRNGCVGLIQEPEAEGVLPLLIGLGDEGTVALIENGQKIKINGIVIPFGSYIEITGAYISTGTPEDPPDNELPQELRDRIESAPKGCGLQLGRPNYYFDADFAGSHPRLGDKTL